MHCAAYPHTIGVHYDVAGRRIRRGIGVRRSADGDGSHGARYRHARAASATTVTVQYAATGGTASGGVDYTVAGSGTLTFAPGVTTQNIIVNVIGDTDVEPDETVVMTLSSPVGATLASASATGTILNDDAALPPALSILRHARICPSAAGDDQCTGERHDRQHWWQRIDAGHAVSDDVCRRLRAGIRSQRLHRRGISRGFGDVQSPFHVHTIGNRHCRL